MDLKSATDYIKDKGTPEQKSMFEKYLANMSENDELEKSLFKAGVKDLVTGDAMYAAICACIVYAQNIRILHHHIISLCWNPDHEKMEDYYGGMDDLQDFLTEICIANGGTEPTGGMAFTVYDSLEIKDYSAKECYDLCKKYFEDLVALMQKAKESCSDFVASEIETKQYELWFEAEYKIAQRLKVED